MCGRYTLATVDPWDVRARFPVGEQLEIRRRYNVAPGDEVLAVTTDRDGHPRGESLRWGLVPFWVDAPDTRAKLINARAETVAERPAFRHSFESFRCLIVADGFYEWRTGPGGRKEAFHITRTDGEPFAFAGLWARWRARDNGAQEALAQKALAQEALAQEALAQEPLEVRSCAIITAAANAAVAPLHDRMPVILPRDAEEAWLAASTPQPELLSLLVPLSERDTAMRAVGPAVNDVRCDGPECLEAPPPPSQPQPALF